MSAPKLEELACVYASLILHDDGVDITADKLSTLIAAAGLEVEPIWPSIFARALQGKDIKDLLFNFSSAPCGAAAAPAAAAASGAAAAPAAAAGGKKKEEPKPESDEEMGFGLFD